MSRHLRGHDPAPAVLAHTPVIRNSALSRTSPPPGRRQLAPIRSGTALALDEDAGDPGECRHDFVGEAVGHGSIAVSAAMFVNGRTENVIGAAAAAAPRDKNYAAECRSRPARAPDVPSRLCSTPDRRRRLRPGTCDHRAFEGGQHVARALRPGAGCFSRHLAISSPTAGHLGPRRSPVAAPSRSCAAMTWCIGCRGTADCR